MTVITIPQVYGWNILAACAITFQCSLVGATYVRAARKKFGIKYPDMGNGRFSAKLTDDQWTEFNNVQRTHQNYVEGVNIAVVFQLVAGLFFPVPAAWCGLVYIIGRALYAQFYATGGPDKRMLGAIIFSMALNAEVVMVIYGLYKMLSNK